MKASTGLLSNQYFSRFGGRSCTSQIRVLSESPVRVQKRVSHRRAHGFRVEAKSKAEESLKGVLQKGNEVLDFVVDLVPDSVPRSTARLGTGIVGVALTWFLVQKILSTAIFFLFIGGGAYLYFQSQGGISGPKSGSSSDSSDPMEEARKIMDKYK